MPLVLYGVMSVCIKSCISNCYAKSCCFACYSLIPFLLLKVGNRVGKIGGSYGSSKEVQDPVSRSLLP